MRAPGLSFRTESTAPGQRPSRKGPQKQSEGPPSGGPSRGSYPAAQVKGRRIERIDLVGLRICRSKTRGRVHFVGSARTTGAELFRARRVDRMSSESVDSGSSELAGEERSAGQAGGGALIPGS